MFKPKNQRDNLFFLALRCKSAVLLWSVSGLEVIGCVRGTGIVFVLNTTDAKKKNKLGLKIFVSQKSVRLNAVIGLSGNKHIVLGSCSFVKLSVLLLLLQSLRLVMNKIVFAFNNDSPRFGSSCISIFIGLIYSNKVLRSCFCAVRFLIAK